MEPARGVASYGLDEPIARIVLSDKDNNEREVSIGGKGEPLVDPEGYDRDRYFASVSGADSVYLVEYRVLNVIKDLIREGNRKQKRDADKAARRERIPSIADEAEGDAP